MSLGRKLILSAALVAVLSIPGCARFTVSVKKPNPATDYEQATMHAFFWGAIEDKEIAERCESNALDEVRARTNLAYALATVVTLGIWIPMEMEWKCRKRPPQVGDI